ncbi:MAG: ABC transporter substrate-binding protein, partial [Candidatus Thorarchaeota archaeon]
MTSATVVAVILISSLTVVSIPAQSSTNLENITVGPHVAAVMFRVLKGSDTHAVALQEGRVDVTGRFINPSDAETLLSHDDIEIVRTPRNGYGYFTINCAKYPLSVTSLRRAMSFAFNKTGFVSDFWDGWAEPLDSCVPRCNPFCAEDLINEHYYNPNRSYAEYLLNRAGFVDVNNDGFVEAPDGTPFGVRIEVDSATSIGSAAATMLENDLQAIGINASVQYTSFYDYISRVQLHGDFDIAFIGRTLTDDDVSWLAYEYWGEYADEPYFNFPRFSNASYDSWREQLLHSASLAETCQAAVEMQKIWTYESPEIVC